MARLPCYQLCCLHKRRRYIWKSQPLRGAVLLPSHRELRRASYTNGFFLNKGRYTIQSVIGFGIDFIVIEE